MGRRRPIGARRNSVQAASRAVAALSALLASTSAHAQPLPVAPPEAGQEWKVPDTSNTTKPAVEEANTEGDQVNTSYWQRGSTRAFVATSSDVGYLYARPRVSFGYGKPFRTWVGIDVNPVGTNRYLGGYGGVRFALPLVDLRVGTRYVWAFQQYLLAPKDHYHRLDFENQELSRSTYITFEAELTGSVPIGPGSILGIASLSKITGAPSGVYVYDETLRVIVDPPWVARGRLGYAVRLGVEGKISVGIVTDLLVLPGRNERVVRAGLVASAVLSDHVEVLGAFVPPIISPDSIGVAGGDFGQLGIRYRWATGSPADIETPSVR